MVMALCMCITERLSYKGGCGVRERTHFEEFKIRAGLGYRSTTSAYY